MDIVTAPLRLPFLPLQALVRLAEVIRDEAEQELYDPARARRELEQVQEDRARGAASDEDVARTEREITRRLVTIRAGRGEGGDADGGQAG
jgi:chorismate mutase